MRRCLGFGLVLFAIFGCLSESFARQANAMRGPATVKFPNSAASASKTSSFPAVTLDAYVRFFQRVISPVDGARSNMYPTGSDYSRRAFRKHGALLCIVLTTERLMHEGNEIIVAPRIKKYGIWRVYDPVDANDWWWQEPNWVYTPRPAVRQR